MLATSRLTLCLAALLSSAQLQAQELKAPAARYRPYLPPSRMFSCEMPASGWHPFEEEDALGPVVRILGPDNPAGTFRTGLSVRWFDKDTPGYVDSKQAADLLRRPDKATRRRSTPMRPLRVAGALARVFEVLETRILPPERLPASATVVHHYLAVIPSGSGYYVAKLSSTRDIYLDFRDDFVHFLRTFQPLGR